MLLSSEIFVMVVFIIGIPIIMFTLRDSDLPEHRLFMGVYLVLVVSNIATVVEEFYLNSFFNFLEHLSITIASFLFFVAVMRMTSGQKTTSKPATDESRE